MLDLKPEPVDIHRLPARDSRPLVLHIVFRFDTGGLENGVVNLINRMPTDAYRHAVLALREVTEFRRRIQRADVGFISMHKPPGSGIAAYGAVSRVIRQLQPAIVHTRNLGPLEMQPVAAWAGVPVRIHGEHGRELDDLHGNNRRMQWIRRMYSPFVHRYIALSRDLEQYLAGRVGIAPRRISQIYNGVDGDVFCAASASAGPAPLAGCPFDANTHWLIGSVGRMQGVKHQTLLARAFVLALQQAPALRAQARLVLVGDGPLRAECAAILHAGGVQALAWLPGERADVADVMRALSCFALPSLAEGISNTILEAMASGLPVIASAVGGNGELVRDGQSGLLFPSDDVQALANAIVRLHHDRPAAQRMGQAGRTAVDQQYSLQAMVAAYQQVYDSQLAAAKQRH